MRKRQAISFAQMRAQNRRLVVNLLRDEGPMSRAEISRRVGLAPSAIANIIGELIEAGHVREGPLTASGGGRPPTLVEFNGSAGYVIGVNASFTTTNAVLADLAGRVVGRASLPTEPNRGADSVLQTIAEAAGRAADDGGVDKGHVKGVCVGVSGLVDRERGVSVFSPNFDWTDVPVAERLSQLTGLAVQVDNDVRLATFGEWRYGAGRGVSHFACLFAGMAGSGVGLVIDGALHYGTAGFGGEIGHTVIDPDGPRCNCGKYGCLESLASGRAIADAARSALKRGRSSTLWNAVDGNVSLITLEDVAEHARAGDGVSVETLQTAGRYLGAAAAMLANIINPQVIAVGGAVPTLAPQVFEPLNDGFRRHVVHPPRNVTQIVPAELGEDAGPRGAAAAMIEDLFRTDPLTPYHIK